MKLTHVRIIGARISILAVLMGCIVVALYAPAWAANAARDNTVVDKLTNGSVDWSHREVHAIGVGVAPDFATTNAQRRVYAREAAIVAAERNLLTIVQGIVINSSTVVKDLMIKKDVIVRRVNGMLEGAVIVKEKQIDHDTYQVEMAINLYGGTNAVSSVIDLSALSQATIIPPASTPPASTPLASAGLAPALVAPTATAPMQYSGLIIDCRGFMVSRAMCPRILDPQGNNLLATLTCSEELLNERGIAAYFYSLDDPDLKPRVGAHPLIVKAVDVGGKGGFKTDMVLSQADYALVRAEDAKAAFLGQLNIVFLLDRER